jgi:L-iditol 2-dehydrogenase
MKAAVLTGLKQFDYRQVPKPKINYATDVLIRIKTIGICGSDIHYYTSGRIGSQIIQFPFTIGHEASGIVESTGDKVTRVKPGQRIAIDPAVSCGRCDQCLAGREHTCRKLLFLGCPGQLNGCLSEYIVLHEKCCFPINDSLSYEEATLSEPLAIGIYSVERSVFPAQANVAILGTGTIGMSIFHVLRTKNIGNVYVTDRIEERLSFCKKLKPKWSGNPNCTNIVQEISRIEPLLLDIVYECSGDAEAIRHGIQLLKPGGKLVLVGIPETDQISFPIHELRRKEITIINIRRQVHCTQKALDLLDQRQVRVDSMVTHRFKLEETQKAFELVANYKDGVMKAMISIEN